MVYYLGMVNERKGEAMSKTTIRQQTARLLVADMLGVSEVDLPAAVSPMWIAETFGVARDGVYIAIRNGRLPAQRVPSASGKTATWVIDPADAFLLWAPNLTKKTRALEAVPA